MAPLRTHKRSNVREKVYVCACGSTRTRKHEGSSGRPSHGAAETRSTLRTPSFSAA